MGFFQKCKILFSIEVLLYHIRGGVIFRSLWYTLSLHKVSNNYKKSPTFNLLFVANLSDKPHYDKNLDILTIFNILTSRHIIDIAAPGNHW